jgi:ACS family glucarate transporter-like MFS transporter
LPFVLQFFVGLLGGWLADYMIRRGYSATVVRKIAMAFGLLLGLAIVTAPFVESGEAAVLLFAVLLYGIGIAVPKILAVPLAFAPEGRDGLIGGIQAAAGNFGGVVAPIVIGALYQATHSFTSALIAAAAMLCLSAVEYLVLIPRIEPIRLLPSERTAVLRPAWISQLFSKPRVCVSQ